MRDRHGAATLWTILAIPAVLTLLGVMTEVANLWLARVEVTNAMESAALAAVKHWGDAGGGDTMIPRQVGNQFSTANTVNGAPVNLSLIDPTLNYNGPGSPCNQNTCSDGVLVFGAIISDFPEFVFDCCETPGCGAFLIHFDVTGDGNLGGGQSNQWGISVQPTAVNTNVRVVRVIYHLPDSFGMLNPTFDFEDFPATLSSNLMDNLMGNIVQCDAQSDELICTPMGAEMGTSQADIYGVIPDQVKFYINVPYGDDGMGGRLECGDLGPMSGAIDVTNTAMMGYLSKTLAVEFCDPSDPLCEPFDPGDRVRFGALVTDEGSGQIDGDQIGQMATDVTICFSDGTSVQVVFVDTNHRELGKDGACSNVTFPSWGQCETPGRKGMTFAGITDGGGNSLPPDIPPPASNGIMNNGQSLTTFANNGSGFAFAVRAHATVQVPSVICELFCVPIGPFNVMACADALYDCETRRPRLYHLEERNYLCNRPCP